MQIDKKNLLILFFLGTLLIAGIVAVQGQSIAPLEGSIKEAPQQTPAFPEQTRAPVVETRSKYTVNIITNELEFPWGLDFLPDGRMMVSEKPGSIRIVTKEGKVGDPLQGVPPVRYKGSGGMFDLKLAPDFAVSRRVF